jgi:hypothetical protein
MLLNNQQMRAVEREEFVERRRIMAADPPFLERARNKRQILSATKYGYPKTKWDPDVPISFYFASDIGKLI